MQRLGLLFLLAVLFGCDAKLPAPPNATSGTRDPFGDEPESAGVGDLKYAKCRALVVGVTDYSSGTLASLQGPHFDASEVASVLASRYGFEVTLKVGLITGATLRAELENLGRAATPNDALFFFYAGHGLPGHLVPSDATLGSATDRSTWKNVIPFGELAKLLRAPNAHHTLVALDCCFSGTALGDAFKAGVGPLGPPALKIAEKDNLARVFNRRAFQVITAGAGDESVADLVQVSKTYSDLQKDLEGHSPFTGVLLQGLRGLTGRPDGRIPASDLGYYLSTTLVNENESFRAKQSPRYGAIAGEGDFLFLPTAKVLNPKLVVPMYMAGSDYAELRQSAADALLRFLAKEKGADLAPLVGSAVPHLVRLLRDPEPGPRRTAAICLERAARLALVPELKDAVAPLAGIAGNLKARESAEAAAALGRLGPFADESACAALAIHVGEMRMTCDQRFAGRPLPDDVRARLQSGSTALPPADAPLAARFADMEARRADQAWLLTEGLALVERMERRHEMGKSLLERAQRYFQEARMLEARIAAAQALGIAGPPSDSGPQLLRDSTEWRAARDVFDFTPDLRMLWTAGGLRHHESDILSLAVTIDGGKLASLDEGGTIHVWDTATGKHIRTIAPRAEPWNVSWSAAGDLVFIDRHGVVKVENGKTFKTGLVTPIVAPPPPNGDLMLLWQNTVEAGMASHLYDVRKGEWLRRFGCATPGVTFFDATSVLASHPEEGALVRFSIGEDTDELERWPLEKDFISHDLDRATGRIAFVAADGAVWLRHAGASKKILEPGEKPPHIRFIGGGATLLVRRAEKIEMVDVATGVRRNLPDLRNEHSPLASSGTSLFVAHGRALHVHDALDGAEMGLTRRAAAAYSHVAHDPSGASVLLLGFGLERRDAETGAILAWRDLEATDFGFLSPDEVVVLGKSGWMILDAATLAEKRKGPLPLPGVEARLDGNGRLVIFQEGNLFSIDPLSGAVTKLLEMGHSTFLGLDPTGSLAGIGRFQKGFELWDVKTGKVRWAWREGKEIIDEIAFHPTKPEVVLRAISGAVLRLSTTDGHQVKIWQSQGSCDSLAWMPSGKLLVEGTWSNGIRFWNPDDGKIEFQGFEALNRIDTFSFSPDGTRLVIADEKGSTIAVRLEPHRPFDGRMSAGIQPLMAIHPGGVLVVDGDSSALVDFDAQSGLVRWKGLGVNARAQCLAVSQDGRVLRTFEKGYAEVIDKVGGAKAVDLKVKWSPLVLADFFGDRIVGLDELGIIRIWSDDGKEQDSGDINERYPIGDSRAVALSTTGNVIAWITRGGAVVVYDVEENTERSEFDVGVDQVHIALSPDGNRLVSNGRGTALTLWDTKTGQKIRELCPEANLIAMQFDPTGKRLAGTDLDRLRIWEVPSWKLLQSFTGVGIGNNTIRWFDEHRLATYSYGSGLRTWDVRTPAPDVAAWLGEFRFRDSEMKWTGTFTLTSLHDSRPVIDARSAPQPPLVSAAICRRTGNLEAALRFAHAAGADVPGPWFDLLAKEVCLEGQAQMIEGSADHAERLFESVARWAPGRAADLPHCRFLTAFRTGRYEDALKHLDDIKADDVYWSLVKWHLLVRLKRPQDAEKALDHPPAKLKGLTDGVTRSHDVLRKELTLVDPLMGLEGAERALVLLHLGMDALDRGDAKAAADLLQNARARSGPTSIVGLMARFDLERK